MGRAIRSADDAARHAAAQMERLCASCGRRMPEGASLESRWCSDSCRKRRVTAVDKSLERLIDDLLDTRAAGATICPSDVARAYAPEDWRPLMEPVRRAARRMVARGALEITQHGSVVDPSSAKGPIRLRKPRS